MIFLLRTGSSYCLVQLLSSLAIWSAMIVPSAAYYQATGGGYTFSIPTFNVAEIRNQYDAQNWCNGNQSKLLEIRNKDIQDWTRWFLADAINANHMVGNTVMTSGKRLNSQLTWVNGIRYNAAFTVYGQESGYSHSYAYINVTQSGFQIVADTPTVKRSYICEGSSFCSNGFRASGRCYSIIRDTLSWYSARNQCIDKGGDLASFDFIANDAGFSVLNGSGLNPSSTYWIGFTRQNWIWQGSKSEVRYSQWSDGHPYYPDGTFNSYMECLCLLPNPTTYDWLWSECDCTQSYQFVCMTGSTTTLTSRAPSSTSSSPFPVSLSTTVDLAIQTKPMHSLDIPSSFSNSESTSTAAIANPTSANLYPIAVAKNSALAVGLGVGLGIGIPLTITILILALMNARLKRKLNSFEASRNIPSNGISTPAKEGSATTYESLKKDGQTTDNRTYEELNTIIEDRQNTNV